MKKKINILLIVSLLVNLSVFADVTPSFIGINSFSKESKKKSGLGPSSAGNFLRYSSPVGALNVKMMPALYWNSLGIEVEYPVTDAFTVGVNILGKLGRTDGKRVVFKIRPENTQESAYRVELAAKYYLGNTAPVGFYGQFNFSYGNLFFFDGTNRPYTLHSKWKNFEGGIRSPSNVEKPKDYSLGIGGGYQLIVIPKKIIANIMIGTQLYLEDQSGIYPSFYITPSIGYVF